MMKKDILIGIDIGSTNIKSVLFDSDLRIIANESEEIEILFPQPGWTEYNPSDWWRFVKSTLSRCLKNNQIDPARVIGIGVSSLGCCTVPLNEQGDHIYNAIPWHDHRANDEVQFIEENCRDLLFEACGNIPTVLSATPHLMWLKKHEPDVYQNIYKYTEASGFIVQKLTGEFVLDYSIASALDYGFDIHKLDYSLELIGAMGLDVEKYARLHENRKPVGGVTKQAADETGLGEGTPVYLCGLDVVSATLAGGVIAPGQGFYSMGSASNMMIGAEKSHQSPYLTSVMHMVDPDIKLLFGSQASIGFSLKWFQEQFGTAEKEAAKLLDGNIDAFELMTIAALKTKPGAGGLLYFPYLFGKFHPVFKPNAVGTFFGITSTTSKAEFIRAIMEGCVYNMYETIKSAESIGINLDEIITSGGPSKSPLWCQIIADVTNKKVVTIETSEASPLGNAMLVGVEEGVFTSYEEVVSRFIKREKEYLPNQKTHDLYKELFALYNQVYNDLQPSFDSLADIKARLLG